MSGRKPPIDVEVLVGKFLLACLAGAVAVICMLGMLQGWWF